MIRRPPTSTLFPYTTLSDLASTRRGVARLTRLQSSTVGGRSPAACAIAGMCSTRLVRSEEHTSELQSHSDLVCRLLLEKKKKSRSRPRADDPRRKRCSHLAA